MQSTEGFNPYKFGFGADVVWAGDRKPDRWTGRIPPIGRTVDVDNATYTNTIGAVELKTVWTDPEFDPGRDAFYYARVLEIPTPRWTTIQAKQPGIAPPDVVAATVQERAWASPIWYTPSAEARKSAKPGTTVADLKKQGAVPLDDAQLRALIVGKSPFVENTVTGEKYQVTYSASGKAPAAKPATPVEPGCVTQQFAANQGQVQIQHVGRRFTEPSLVGDVAESSYLGASRGYYINNGKIVTALVGTPIEMAVYKLGDSYFGARSNEFGVRTEILYREALALGLDKATRSSSAGWHRRWTSSSRTWRHCGSRPPTSSGRGSRRTPSASPCPPTATERPRTSPRLSALASPGPSSRSHPARGRVRSSLATAGISCGSMR